MRFRLFQYPLPADGELPELNVFLAAHRVATVQHHIVTTAGGPMLVFVVEAATGAAPATGGGRIDYREVLSPEDFEVFRQLREARKRAAEAQGVPVYAVFSNAQLAAMAERRCATAAELAGIEGVGEGRVERFGEAVLAVLRAAVPRTEGKA